MMKFYTLATFLLLVAGITQAQSLSLKGQLQDKADKSALNGATVTLVLKKDSTVKYTVATDRKGGFEINNISIDTFLLTISSIGYAP